MADRFQRLAHRLTMARDSYMKNAEGVDDRVLVRLYAADLRRHAELLSEAAAMIQERGKPVGYLFELARAKLLDGSGYCNFGPRDFSPAIPVVPEGAVRNVTPVYSLDDVAPTRAASSDLPYFDFEVHWAHVEAVRTDDMARLSLKSERLQWIGNGKGKSFSAVAPLSSGSYNIVLSYDGHWLADWMANSGSIPIGDFDSFDEAKEACNKRFLANVPRATDAVPCFVWRREKNPIEMMVAETAGLSVGVRYVIRNNMWVTGFCEADGVWVWNENDGLSSENSARLHLEVKFADRFRGSK